MTSEPTGTMNLLPTAEQEEIASSAAAFLAHRFPMARVRELIGTPDPVDAASWREVATLGWFGLGLPEAAGGVGVGLADEVLLFREIGRSSAPGPFLATALAARLAHEAARTDLRDRLLAGVDRAGMALLGHDGTVRVVDGLGAEVVLVVGAERAALHRTDDLDLVDERCVDEGTRLASGRLGEAAPVAATDGGALFDRGVALSAALLAGIAERCRDLAVEHATNRHQFGKAIGSNQAIKHPIADMAVRAAAAWSQTVVAALAADEGRPDARFHALSARVAASEAADRNAAACIQVMGGIGYTFEHDAHLLLKRAGVLRSTFGGDAALLAALIDEPNLELT